jgi:hypothetical protein
MMVPVLVTDALVRDQFVTTLLVPLPAVPLTKVRQADDLARPPAQARDRADAAGRSRSDVQTFAKTRHGG